MTPPVGPPSARSRPLDAGLFSFHGFGDDLANAQQRLRRAGIRGGEPEVAVVEDAVFVPAVDRRKTGQQSGQPDLSGGIVTHTGQPIGTAHLRRGGRKLIAGLTGTTLAVPSAEMDEEVVYLGWLFDTYGHFLLESLARTWILHDVDPAVRVVFHAPTSGQWRPRSWALQILAAFGIPSERLLLPNACTRFRRVIVPEPLFEVQHAAHERGAGPHRAVAARIASRVEPSKQPVYLSRRLLPSSQRAIIGEAELEDVLRENGFLVAYPETMTFEEQVRLVNAHTDIFSSAGSAAHSVLFALNEPRLHLLTGGDQINLNFFLCSALAGAPTTFIKCLETGERPIVESGPGGLRSTPDMVATPRLVDYLDERGLLRSRVRAELAARNPALRDEYDAAWFYARVRAASRGAALPDELEREAVTLAARSWSVSLALARYFVRRDASRIDEMVRQFITLVTAEPDNNRLARHRTDVAQVITIVAQQCDPRTAAALTQVASDRFHIPPPR